MNSENRDIREISSIQDIANCIKENTYGEAPLQLIQFFEDLPSTALHDYLRVLSAPYLFHLFEEKVLINENPKEWFPKELEKFRCHCENLLQTSSFVTLFSECFETTTSPKAQEEVKEHTGRHYGNLFKNFDHKSYFGEAKKLLETRLERNGIEIPNLEQLSLLDQGCGGGRYTAAWKLLGAGEAVGLDFSSIGLEDAKKRIEIAGMKDISFIHGSVLDMPFEDASFDIVFSNGVLHHTEDWQKGIAEQLRVLKNGGHGWLYLIEEPGGLYWDKTEILRALLRNVDKDFAQRILRSMNIPDNRVFYMLDHPMVPINTRLTPERVEAELEKNGADSIQRLTRGTDFDRVEYIHNKIPFAREKFGVGENRYFFSKRNSEI